MKWLLILTFWASSAEPVAHADWATVLTRFVDEGGRIDFNSLRKEPELIRRQVEFVGRAKLEDYPATADRLAFLLNAYNALAMSHAAFSGLEPKSKVRFFYLAKHQIAGTRLSLHALENQIIRPIGEPRVHFALNCMVRGCPRLPKEPFTVERLQAQLNAAAQEFFNSPKHVQVLADKRVVRFSAILKWYKEDFLEKDLSLIGYANRYRDTKIPGTHSVEFLPYDWELNAP